MWWIITGVFPFPWRLPSCSSCVSTSPSTRLFFALVAHLWEGSPRLWIFGLPGAWVALEWVRAHALSGFPWGNLGYSQTPFLTLIQVADVTGVYGLSWLLVCSNTTLAGCLRWPPARKVALPLVCVLLGSTLMYGSWRLERIHRFQSEVQPWHAAVVQGNIDQSKKWDPAFQQEPSEIRPVDQGRRQGVIPFPT